MEGLTTLGELAEIASRGRTTLSGRITPCQDHGNYSISGVYSLIHANTLPNSSTSLPEPSPGDNSA
eukprot:4630863-Lingulodinium_polyedra.AAC.1